ncbi:hypothetical protein IJM86_00550 [bacterium]|nr:hypothetical protein [bacterium]
MDNIEPKENLTFTSGETITAKSFFEDLPGGVTVSVKEGENITTNIGENTVTVMLKYEEQTRFMEIRYFVEKSQEQIETERVQGIVDQINQYKDQVNAIETVDYSSLITKMNNTTSDKLSSEIA